HFSSHVWLAMLGEDGRVYYLDLSTGQVRTEFLFAPTEAGGRLVSVEVAGFAIDDSGRGFTNETLDDLSGLRLIDIDTRPHAYGIDESEDDTDAEDDAGAEGGGGLV